MIEQQMIQEAHAEHIAQESTFQWFELFLNWSLEISIAVIVPIAIAVIMKRRNKDE